MVFNGITFGILSKSEIYFSAVYIFFIDPIHDLNCMPMLSVDDPFKNVDVIVMCLIQNANSLSHCIP